MFQDALVSLLLFVFTFFFEKETMPQLSVRGLFYYFIPQRSNKDHTSKNPKPPRNTYTPDNE
jgi:hypothetical protein